MYDHGGMVPDTGAVRRLVSGEYDGKPLQIQILLMEDPCVTENLSSDTIRVMIMDFEFSAEILVTRQLAVKLRDLYANGNTCKMILMSTIAVEAVSYDAASTIFAFTLLVISLDAVLTTKVLCKPCYNFVSSNTTGDLSF